VTKSIVSLLYGMALADGLVPGLDDSLLDHFPAYADLAADPRRRKILVRHALAMQMATEWSEDLPYTDPRNSEIAMEMAADIATALCSIAPWSANRAAAGPTTAGRRQSLPV
jgi:CubicO group peptidase (beta-lactamase class C family)